MEAAGEDANDAGEHLIYKPMFLCNAPRPASSEFVPEGLRFSDARVRIALNIANELQNAKHLTAIVLRPPAEVFERG